MDNKLIEAAARAIASSRGTDPDTVFAINNTSDARRPEPDVAMPAWRSYRADARAAILAFLDAAAGDEVVEKVARGIYNARIAGGRNYSEFDDLCTNGFNTAYDGVMDEARAALSALKGEVKP